ncbi:MAG: sugar ABC transporter ATP-binding protein [Opitutaceae bacterium]|nr:sugar ABC transporter ATP-binding protein [Verrucomicrobiales bacterium]
MASDLHHESRTTGGPLLAVEGIEKSFFSVRVLKSVSFTVPVGGMVGLIGENGAGKSTLMNILGGNLRADAGRVRFNGLDFRPANPLDAARQGIAFIHQELNLFPNLTIAENLFLTRFPLRGGLPLIDRPEINRRAAELLRDVGLELPPERLVEFLSAGERQLVEIAKALSIDARLIIFDEPTTSLSLRETEHLFALIGRLRARGVAMIYISHTLGDVTRLCDDVVILRDGEVVGAGPSREFTQEKLVSLMVGRTMNQLFPERGQVMIGAPILEVRNVSRTGVVRDVSFSVRRGEVLGLFGLMGAGRSELARLLFGLDPRTSGEVRLDGEGLRTTNPRDLIRRGFAFLTENRRLEGLCLDSPVADNLTMVTLPEHGRTPLRWLSFSSLNAAVHRIRDVVRLDAKTRDSQPVRTLSGGNQQKVVLGKWLLREPRLLILDEPTRGIDVGAKYEIYRLIHELAGRGAGILVISSEMDEVMGICDRLLVMKGGGIVDELPRAEFDRKRILHSALGTESAKEISA